MKTKVILVLVVVALLLSVSEARRRRKEKRNRDQDGKCKYGRPVTKTGCVNGTMTKTFTLKRQNAYNNCSDTKSFQRPCKMKCKYDVTKAPCDPNTQKMTKTYTLRAGEDANCRPTFTKEKRCRVKDKCKYKPNKKSGCDENNMMELTLKRGPDTCAPTKQIPCSEKMKRKMEKIKNRLSRKERRKERRQNRAKAKCRYIARPWTECDLTTDTMSRTMTLDQGDPHRCEAIKILRRKCKKQCRYKQGTWSSCNPKTNLKQRTDRLKPNSSEFCLATRSITKKCGGKGRKKGKKGKGRKCKYEKGTWGSCDPITQKRSKVHKLVSGDTNRCKPEKIVRRACVRPDGRERCFFGKWQEWEACQNGVQKKQRPVLQGGMECQRRGVKTRACNS